MSILDIQLEKDRQIHLDGLLVEESYSGRIMGGPTKREYDFIRSQLESKAKHAFGQNPIFVIEPEMQVNESGVEIFPRFLFIGDFISYKPIHNPKCTGSGLIMVWFQDIFGLQEIEASLSKVSNAVWEQNAKEFDFI
jgi:hypothetical protein